MSEPLEAETSSPIRTRYVEDIPARLYAKRPGYIQRIVFSHLSTVLQRPGLYLYLSVRPGDFVTEETVLAEVGRRKRLMEHAEKPFLRVST